MKQVNSFVAFTGDFFTSKEECLAHEARVRTSARIDAFLVNLSPSDRRESEYRRVLGDYEDFCTTYVEPEFVEGQPDGTAEQDPDLG